MAFGHKDHSLVFSNTQTLRVFTNNNLLSLALAARPCDNWMRISIPRIQYQAGFFSQLMSDVPFPVRSTEVPVLILCYPSTIQYRHLETFGQTGITLKNRRFTGYSNWETHACAADTWRLK